MLSADLRTRIAAFGQKLSPLRRYLGPKRLAALAGALAALTHPPFGFLPGLLGYGLLLYVLNGDLGPKPLRRAFAVGFWAGFVYFLISCFWVAEAFLVDAETFGWMAPFAVMILPAMIAFFWGLFGIVYAQFAPKSGVKSLLCFAVWFCGFEMIRGWIFTGFPWNPAGAGWMAGSALSQMAALVGVYGLSLITVMAFASVAIIKPALGLKGYRPVMVAAGALLVCFAFGQYRLISTQITPSTTSVRLVQTNIGQEAKWTESEFSRIVRDYVTMTHATPKYAKWSATGADYGRRPDIVIWPEGALPASAEELFSASSWTSEVFARLLEPDQTLMMGVYRSDLDKGGNMVWRNTMLVIQQKAHETRIVAAYDKFKLVPFGEFLPFENLLTKIGVKNLVNIGDGFTPGDRTKAMTVDGIPSFLPLICYEGLFPTLDQSNYSFGKPDKRPQWIVNISNDAWFGPTSGPIQHLNLSAYRAIEQGLPMVRSTPTGISVVVDPLGRVIPSTKLGVGRASYIDVMIPKAVKLTTYGKFYVIYVIFISIFSLILLPYNTLLGRVKKTS
ncbi:apolipoprotein N-acyltransferase [Asticcacaulis sp. SL142]|uniref:apolipoprotein N-acyltransferase n=1 Tax=Asticcacaulis sp. SL142 TaxID=2995155 RepID=UPI00226D221B|nr:apolipoprotein N-acyltransferase [Asticcacaulis sp. SL142]WAC47202.1 apolipoprotein N-acyltransferase [Asticcacaulis sp. SL142]